MAPPAIFEIRIKGHLNQSWVKWFEGMEVCIEPQGETVLKGQLTDQAALHGVLSKIRDLGLTLVSLQQADGNIRDIP